MNENYILSSETVVDPTTGYKGLESGTEVYLLIILEETEADSTPVIRHIDISFEED
jgi:hypothetical protein